MGQCKAYKDTIQDQQTDAYADAPLQDRPDWLIFITGLKFINSLLTTIMTMNLYQTDLHLPSL